jgi:hypothetical protein
MVLTPDDIKAITSEIASHIITELKRPVEKSFSEKGPTGIREATYNNKDALVGSLKDHERRTHREITNERKQD